jgi:hypothetical protein
MADIQEPDEDEDEGEEEKDNDKSGKGAARLSAHGWDGPSCASITVQKLPQSVWIVDWNS